PAHLYVHLILGIIAVTFALLVALTGHLFHFYSHVHHRGPHSFPTRRSSDLFALTIAASVLLSTFCALTLTPALSALLLRHQNGQDRKSTRLNSSHVKISYAVFCLKKKNTSTRNAPHSQPPQAPLAAHRHRLS